MNHIRKLPGWPIELICPFHQDSKDDSPPNFTQKSGIPVLMDTNLIPTHSGYEAILEENEAVGQRELSNEEIDSFLEANMVPTCGNLYHGWSRHDPLPIPSFPFKFPGDVLLDLGCNWGRWSIAAALAGYKVIACDIHLKGLLVAEALCRRLKIENPPKLLLCDARSLPIADASLDGVFSYSVVQHFSKENADTILNEVGRSLRVGGRSLIQMPNRKGLRCYTSLARRGFSEGKAFDVRYYDLQELLDKFTNAIGPSDWEVDCFFGLNVHANESKQVKKRFRTVVAMAEAARKTANIFQPLQGFSDSVFIRSEKR